MKYITSAILIVLSFGTKAQSLYFPPINGNEWQTLSPASLGWCEERIDSLYDVLEENNTKAFIVLKDGKIILEKYFGTFQQDSVWYWAMHSRPGREDYDSSSIDHDFRSR